ncbi:MAG: hypothetical protein M1831_001270 [Alyxoria varia]|nr:MAG: hypothetical protein M1831_001270 [Alyxoria varia]
MADKPRPKRLVGVSTKMYFGVEKTKAYTNSVLRHLTGKDQALLDKADVFIIPDFVSLSSIAAAAHNTKIMVGAQDCYHEDTGAFTGEVSPTQLREVGCNMVELGHAERRRLFGETDEWTAKKAAATARNGMIPLVCIGERTQGPVATAAEECRPQVESVLNAVPDDAEVILAYEPVWAIGKAEPAGSDHVVGVAKELRKMATGRKGTTRILYGGSAGPGLFEKLVEGVDGLFLGRFAHQVEQFVKTIGEIADAPEPA